MPTVGNTGAQITLAIRQGVTLSLPITMRDDSGVVIDITGRTYRGDITRADTGAVVLSFTCAVTDGPNGAWLASLTAAQTAALTEGVPLRYSLEQVVGSVVTEIFYGSVTLGTNL